MCGIIKSELLKMHSTFSAKLVFFAPSFTVLIGYALSGSFVQFSAYNWWYTLILPIINSIWAANTIVCEKKTGLQNVVCLPCHLEKFWIGKFIALLFLLFETNMLLWTLTTFAGFIINTVVNPLDGLISCLFLFLTYLWQIPFVMLLTSFLGYIPTIIVSVAANVLLSTIGVEKSLFMINPYAIPSRIVCPFLKMQPNGIPIESDSLLLSDSLVPLALLVSLTFAILILFISVILSRKRGKL